MNRKLIDAYIHDWDETSHIWEIGNQSLKFRDENEVQMGERKFKQVLKEVRITKKIN